MKYALLVASLLATSAASAAVYNEYTPLLQVNRPAAAATAQGQALRPIMPKTTAVNRITPATTDIITSPPAGTQMKEVVWSSNACAPVNGKVQWVEVSGFVPTIVTDNNTMYIYCPLTQLSDIAKAWIKGTISEDGKTVTFATPQAYMLNEATPGIVTTLYATRVSSTTAKPEESTDLVFAIGEDGGLTQTDGGLLALTDDNGGFYGYGDMNIMVTKINETVNVMPADAVCQTYIMDYMVEKTSARQSAVIGRSGDEVYFSDPLGFEDSWFKGTLNGDKVTVTTPQYMGAESGYPLYLVTATEFTRTETDMLGQIYDVTDYKVVPGADIVFEYDAATDTYTTDQILLLSSDKENRGMASAPFKKATYTSWTPVGVAPANPSVSNYFDLFEYAAYGLRGCMMTVETPNEGNDGEFIPQEHMYYTIYIDNEPLEVYGFTTLPFYAQVSDATIETYISVSGNTHQVQIPVAPTSKLGVQSFYEFGDELLASDLIEYDIVDRQLIDPNGVESVMNDIESVSSEYFDIYGRRVAADATGLVIRRDTMSDGSQRSVKLFN